MLATDANPFGNLKMQPLVASVTPEPVRAPVPQPTPSAFVLPKTAAVPQTAPPPPNPMVLFSNALGFGNFVSLLVGNKAVPNAATSNKPGGLSFVESSGWEENSGTEEDMFNLPSGLRRIPAFMNDAENPFNHSLNLLS
jgi:hypothetical protein